VSMHVEVTRRPTYVVAHVQGEVDLATAPELREILSEFPPGQGTVIVDLTDVGFLDSSGLSVLVEVHQHLASNGQSELRLVVTRPTTRRLLEATGLLEVFDVHSSLDDATRGL
jgi:anti-sigma B factor antagonist